MTTEERKALTQEQKTTKPKIDDVIENYLSGEPLKNLQDFIAYLREIKLSPRWASTNAWASKHKSQLVSTIRLQGSSALELKENEWVVHMLEKFGHNYLDEFISCEKFKEVVWNNIKPCNRCSSCGPRNKEYMGKKFDSICGLRIINPSGETLDYVKKIVEANKRFVLQNI